MPENIALAQVMRYHQETKHQFNRYARALGYLDWANQPNPFRRFQAAPMIQLTLRHPDEIPDRPSYEDLYREGSVAPASISLSARRSNRRTNGTVFPLQRSGTPGLAYFRPCEEIKHDHRLDGSIVR